MSDTSSPTASIRSLPSLSTEEEDLIRHLSADIRLPAAQMEMVHTLETRKRGSSHEQHRVQLQKALSNRF